MNPVAALNAVLQMWLVGRHGAFVVGWEFLAHGKDYASESPDTLALHAVKTMFVPAMVN